MNTRAALVAHANAHAPAAVPANGAHDPACFHGGAFFDAIGDGFDRLDRRHAIINADVLDAWFPPAPGVLEALHEHLGWLLRTSPPTQCEGLVRAISHARRVSESSVLAGAGSSDLIFLALTHWLHERSRVLILDPMYGEYAHVLERVVGCRVDRLRLDRTRDFVVDPAKLAAALQERYDLVVLVNPNSPTGQHVPGHVLADVLQRVPVSTRVWVDETYVEYVGAGQSLERLAAASPNVVVCKSMSKVYALSGVRAAYLVGAPGIVQDLRHCTPPWAVSLPGQVAAVKALEAPDYYRRCHEETNRLREQLAVSLGTIEGVGVTPSVANFLLCHLDHRLPEAAHVVRECRRHGLFLRDAGTMSASLGPRAIRIAVKDAVTNLRILKILRGVLARDRRQHASRQASDETPER